MGLLVATGAAFVITEHLKLIRSPVYDTNVTKAFSPAAGGRAEIGFRLRHGDSLTVSILDSSRHTVATVAADVYRRKGLVRFAWDGKTDAGTTAADGNYQPQIKLENRTILMPNKIEVDTAPPAVVSASAARPYFAPGAKHTIAIHYVFSKDAHPELFLHGTRLVLGRHTRSRGDLKWNGLRAGAPLRAGRYVLQLGAIDLAGNETPASGWKTVVIALRDIVLAQTHIHVGAGARFTVGVQTAAAKYSWRLAGKHGSGKGKTLHLRAPTQRGRYRLVVTADGHSAAAIVIVGKK